MLPSAAVSGVEQDLYVLCRHFWHVKTINGKYYYNKQTKCKKWKLPPLYWQRKVFQMGLLEE